MTMTQLRPHAPVMTVSKNEFLRKFYSSMDINNVKDLKGLPTEQRAAIDNHFITYVRENDHFWVLEYDQFIIDLRMYYKMLGVQTYMGVKRSSGLVLGCMHDSLRVFLLPENALGNVPQHAEIDWIPVADPIAVESLEFTQRVALDGTDRLHIPKPLRHPVQPELDDTPEEW